MSKDGSCKICAKLILKNMKQNTMLMIYVMYGPRHKFKE